MTTYSLNPSGTVNNPITVLLSAKELLNQQMTMTAQNLSNGDTPGFKGFLLQGLESLYKNNDPQSDIPLVSYVQAGDVQRDLSQGSFKQTNNAYDLAINGRGYFVIQMNGQRLYTRDGRFRLNAEGLLTTMDGYEVMGENGSIQLKGYTDVKIHSNGSITALQNGAPVSLGSMIVTQFKDEQNDIEYQGFGRFSSQTDGETAKSISIAAGFLENSNVDPVTETIRLMRIMRMYQEAQRVTETQDELSSKTINLRIT